ncbi:MAG TPA: hypothetical protein VE981_08515 [Planctomycetota bacterium]|nr:hypothetical protein [Planctomycetota bacterium]
MCALRFQGQKCRLCDQGLDRTKPEFATSGVFLPKEDPLWQYCDAILHFDCYAPWKDRPRFARAYFQMWVEAETTSGYWGKAYLDEAHLVTVNKHPPEESVRVVLARWGIVYSVKLADWERWCREDAAWVKDAHPWVQNDLKFFLPICQERMPTVPRLLGQVDWALKERRIAELKQREEAAKAFKQQQVDDYNERAEKLVGKVTGEGIVCPKCSRSGKDFRVMRGAKTYLICVGCGGSVWPDDLGI